MDELDFTFDDTELDVPFRTAGAETVDRVTVRRRALHVLEAEQLVDMLDYVESARAEGEQYSRSAARTAAQAAAHDLSLALGVAPGTVVARLAMARRVRGRLPAVWKAFLGGSVSQHHVGIVDVQLQRLTEPDSPAVLDERIARYAADHTVPQTRRWLSRQVERLEADAARERHRRARADRHVRLSPAGDGMAWLSALVPEVDGHAALQRLDTEARGMSADPRTHDQRCADLFTGLLLGSPDPEAESAGSDRGGVSTVIGITVPVTSLMGLSDAPGELADHSASVPAALVREKAVEPGTVFYRLLTDDHGHLLDATHLGRFAPEKIRTALWFRDGTTSFPTSDVPASRSDIDHTDAWPAPTRGTNLGPIHRRAHRLKTAGLYRLRRRGRSWEWTTRTGHVYRHDPDPLPVEQWPELLPAA
ncbi:HNH endonuclease signature motif containing protein [Aeromicrobium sp. Leaf272]|uniref:HNH endonuclease signature motif containing protein n=1 Tax=Aeromicrobium sp. Leaf272 TaxID=1736317 RepID=UPI0006F5EB35|nr:HNH endonuclease signature motif containing protein [Aeromicrobium sp. Leaf272]KQP25539.1 hypothetical protein ASF38_13820 [Aeromicrobium sp. Leaf272]